MAEAKKIKQEELETIQKQQSELNDVLRNLGVLEVQKNLLIKNFDAKQKEVDELKVKLENTYGKVNINLNDGTYSPIEEAEEEKESDK